MSYMHVFNGWVERSEKVRKPAMVRRVQRRRTNRAEDTTLDMSALIQVRAGEGPPQGGSTGEEGKV